MLHLDFFFSFVSLSLPLSIILSISFCLLHFFLCPDLMSFHFSFCKHFTQLGAARATTTPLWRRLAQVKYYFTFASSLHVSSHCSLISRVFVLRTSCWHASKRHHNTETLEPSVSPFSNSIRSFFALQTAHSRNESEAKGCRSVFSSFFQRKKNSKLILFNSFDQFAMVSLCNWTKGKETKNSAKLVKTTMISICSFHLLFSDTENFGRVFIPPLCTRAI